MVLVVITVLWATFAWAVLRLLRGARAADAPARAELARRGRLATGFAAVALAVPAAAAGAPSSCAGADALPGSLPPPQAAEAVTCVIDEHRSAAGLRHLRTHPDLARSASRYARRMVEERFFSHLAPDGERFVDRLRATGWLPSAGTYWAGENLAWGTLRAGTPAGIVAAWLESPSHGAVVLGNYRHVGVGMAEGLPLPSAVEAGATYVLHSGRRIRRVRAP